MGEPSSTGFGQGAAREDGTGESCTRAQGLCSPGLWLRIAQGSPREGIAELRMLLQAGHDLFATDERGRTCAHLAAEFARGWELHFLLSIERACRERTPDRLQGQDSLLRVKTNEGHSLLHVAASRGHAPIVRYLVTVWDGMDANSRNCSGRTALHEATARDHHQIVKLLLKAGVAMDLVDCNGHRPLDVAVAGETKQLLEDAQDKISQMRDPSYGVVAYLRCEASYALDRILTPVAYSLADTYTPPPLRRGPTLASAALPVFLGLASFTLALPLSVALVVACCIAVRMLPASVLSCSPKAEGAVGDASGAVARNRSGSAGDRSRHGEGRHRWSNGWLGRRALLCWEEEGGEEVGGSRPEAPELGSKQDIGPGMAGESESSAPPGGQISSRRPLANRREVAVGFWRACVMVYVGTGLCLWGLPSLQPLITSKVQGLFLSCFLGASLCMVLAALATCGADPGTVEWEEQGLSAALQHVMDYGAPPGDFDAASMLRRPLRSKLCRESGGVCIARFDHFCIWINRPIGAGNHLLFLSFVGLQAASLFFFLCLTVALLSIHGDEGFWLSVLLPPRSGLFILAAFGAIVLSSLTFLLLFQIRNVLVNLTTNEFMNLERYPHFWRGPIGPDGKRRFANPFDKGVIGNVSEFFGIGGRVEYVRLFSEPRGPSWRRRSSAAAAAKRTDAAEELQVLVVPTGWASGEAETARWVPPALPLQMPGLPSL